ncbi:hypothetical protein AAFX24_28485 [Vibrio mediterranei]|uniref:hypothetical protein n=1 Tax=Vibrio mediterranei TaxID=689 RepID=UPI0038CE57B7
MSDQKHQESEKGFEHLSDLDTISQGASDDQDPNTELDELFLDQQQTYSSSPEADFAEYETVEEVNTLSDSGQGGGESIEDVQPTIADDNDLSVFDNPMFQGETDDLDLTQRGDESSPSLQGGSLESVDLNSADTAAASPKTAKSVNVGKEKPTKLPLFAQKRFVYGVVVLFVCVIISGGAILVRSIYNALNPAPVAQVQESQQIPAVDAPVTLTASDDANQVISASENDTSNQLFNGIGVEVSAVDADLANAAPLLKEYITRLEGSLQTAKSELTQAEARRKALNEQLISQQNTSKQLRAELLATNETLEDRTRELEARNTEIQTLNDSLNANGAALVKERNEVTRVTKQLRSEKVARQAAEKRYTELANTRNDDLTKIQQQLVELQKSVSKSNQRAARPASKPSNLRYIDTNESDGLALFGVLRNGVAVKKISLSKGEYLIGRGVVEEVDDYGCIILEGGKIYEPVGAFCPNR